MVNGLTTSAYEIYENSDTNVSKWMKTMGRLRVQISACLH